MGIDDTFYTIDAKCVDAGKQHRPKFLFMKIDQIGLFE